jgi:surface polysaccharide O-acyltransferase-like enzyme
MDVIRALATIAVILIHVSATILYRVNANSNTYRGFFIINQLSRFSVPAFIMLSGIGLINTYKRENGYFKFLLHRLYKIIPRYLVWCFIYILFITKTFNIYKAGNDIIFGNVFYHLYFVPIIVQFYLIFPFVYKFIDSKWSLVTTFIITSSILVSIHYFNMPGTLVWFFERKNMLNWVFYFSLGAFIGKNMDCFKEKALKYRVPIFTIFIAVTFGLIYGAMINTKSALDLDFVTTFLRPSVLVYTIVFVLLVFSIEWKENLLMKLIQYVSRSSYGIYLSHAFILYEYTQYCTNRSIPINTLQFGIKAFFISFIGAILINQSRKLP